MAVAEKFRRFDAAVCSGHALHFAPQFPAPTAQIRPESFKLAPVFTNMNDSMENFKAAKIKRFRSIFE
jgi:hypothetical protein